jgi:phage protein U
VILLGDLRLPALAIRSVGFRNGASYAVHEVIEGKPRRQFIGESAPVASLSLYLHVEYIAPRPTVTELRRLNLARELLPLWTNAGSFWGTYVIEDVDHRPVWTMPDGRMIVAECEVSLTDPGVEWTLPRPRPLAVAGSARNIITTPKAEDTSRPIDEITPQEIARV